MKYKVRLPFLVYVEHECEADSEQEAIDISVDEVQLTNYCGNGGSDKLIGSYDTDDTIECGEFFEDGVREIIATATPD